MLSPLDFHSVLLLSSCFFTSCEPSKADPIRTCGTHSPKPICLVCRCHRWFRLSNISKVGSIPVNNPIVYSLIYSSKKYKLSFSSSFLFFFNWIVALFVAPLVEHLVDPCLCFLSYYKYKILLWKNKNNNKLPKSKFIFKS